jgi:flagellin
MAFSIQTNVNSLIAQENLRVNSNFQSQTIQRLTSGYRINSSGDDAAGLAIANKFRSDTAELSQGVRNANDGVSTLQIIDGGMNNIAKMLDRLRTLATQSASDTFTGDRNVLNSEFKSLTTEIDRQAQSIGLDTNGKFAKSLEVYLGGGHAASTGNLDTNNGTVTVNLTGASVDTQSLGLKGMQVVAGNVDIGPNGTHKVADILANGSNNQAVAGYAQMYVSGAGFSDSTKIKLSVNLAGVTDVTTLAAAVNSAITNAASGNTQAATAFKNAGIVAGVHTGSGTEQQLSFTSSSSAFQVEAGDQMANALLGNMSGTLGTAVKNTTTTGNTATAGTGFTASGVTVRISGGGLSAAQDITFATSTNIDQAISELNTNVNANAALKAAGITVSGAPGGALTFTSATGEKVNVMATGDAAGTLGMGGFMAGNSGEVDYTSRVGTAYDKDTKYGNTVLEFSVNGGASNVAADTKITINLDGGDATQGSLTSGGAWATQAGKKIGLLLDGVSVAPDLTLSGGASTAEGMASDINGSALLNGTVKASVDGAGHVVLTALGKGAHTITLSGTTDVSLTGLAAGANFKGSSRTDSDLKDALNSAFAASSTLQKAGLQATVNTGTHVLTIGSSNNTFFRMNASNTAGTGAIGFGSTGGAATTFGGVAVNTSKVSVLDANGTSNTRALDFSALSFGSDDQSISIAANDSNGTLHTKTIILKNDAASRTGKNIDETLAYINTQLQQSNDSTLQKIVAVKENNGGAEQINFLSSLSKFSVGLGNSANGNALNSGGAATKDSQALGTGTNISIESKSGALAAVTAVATAIATLGTAQAAIGKGQNQLNYAIGLAQSQISNFSAAESRIRDADVASEAANLTKAQVLQQASMAAMAQANSAPQAVLALLRG